MIRKTPKKIRPENEGKFCIRECARDFIPIEDNLVKVYCPACDRTIRILKKKDHYDFNDINDV